MGSSCDDASEKVTTSVCGVTTDYSEVVHPIDIFNTADLALV